MSKYLDRIRRIEESHRVNRKRVYHVYRDDEPTPEYDPNDGQHHTVFHIIHAHMDAKDGRLFTQEEIEALNKRGEEILQSASPQLTENSGKAEPIPAQSTQKTPPAVEPKKNPATDDKTAWWNAKRFEEADFKYKKSLEPAYRTHASQKKIDAYEEIGLCPPPEGAMLSTWPPEKEKEWLRCKEAYKQALEDAKAAAYEFDVEETGTKVAAHLPSPSNPMDGIKTGE